MKTIAIVLLLLAGCTEGGASMGAADADGSSVDAGPQPCAVESTAVVVVQDCKAKISGMECVEDCGRIPDDGGAGTLLGNGCTVQIGTSAPLTGLCVSSCADCQ